MTEPFIKELSFAELKDIYDQYSCKTFPPEELEPWDKVAKLYHEKRYLGWGLYDEKEELCCYAFFSITPHGLYLLNMLETVPEKRGSGYGQKMLAYLKEHYAPQPLFIEVEAPELAANEEERLVRERRMKFYHKLKAYDTTLRSSLGGIVMHILAVNSNLTELDLHKIHSELSLHYPTVYNPASHML